MGPGTRHKNYRLTVAAANHTEHSHACRDTAAHRRRPHMPRHTPIGSGTPRLYPMARSPQLARARLYLEQAAPHPRRCPPADVESLRLPPSGERHKAAPAAAPQSGAVREACLGIAPPKGRWTGPQSGAHLRELAAQLKSRFGSHDGLLAQSPRLSATIFGVPAASSITGQGLCGWVVRVSSQIRNTPPSRRP